MSYKAGDSVLVLDPYPKEDGSWSYKKRPAIIYDVIDKSHYCLLFYSRDSHSKRPVMLIKSNSKHGKLLGIDHDSYLMLKGFIKLERRDIIQLIGNCTEDLLIEIDEKIEEHGVKRP